MSAAVLMVITIDSISSGCLSTSCHGEMLACILHISLRKTVGKCHRFWLRLRHTVILISNKNKPDCVDPNSNSFSITFERKKGELYGFRQTGVNPVRNLVKLKYLN